MTFRDRFSGISLVTMLLTGCGALTPPVDDTPFRAAIDRYLTSNNMVLVIKEIKAAPVIDGNAAELQASLTHAQLGGPSVVWTIHFEKQADGSWQVTHYEK